MGIGFVLFFWAIAGTILASIGSLIFGAVATFLTKGVAGSRKRAIVLACTFPFVCLGWAGTIFIVQAVVNGAFLHRDAGLGDTWECPLPNGYAIMMIDVTDQGWVYNPKTQSDDSVFEKEDAIGGVRTVQVAGKYILGASDSHAASSFGKPPTDPDLYFLLDTQTGHRTNFKNSQELKRAASQVGVRVDLEDIQAVYSRYRFTWFDVFVLLLLVLPLAAYFLILVRWIIKLRRRGLAALPV